MDPNDEPPGSAHPWAPGVGELVLDPASGLVGEYRGAEDGLWYLRPRGGGIEWCVRPGRVRPVVPVEGVRGA
ncbi:hypothetical protein AB0K43_19060 [Kitasatospora sp. NPDC049258]|uniref:hypothetical protein n=1 Tax=Kitasatospora sp. NPDC049258 TaxID=3155394 RepID=UPI0034403A81